MFVAKENQWKKHVWGVPHLETTPVRHPRTLNAGACARVCSHVRVFKSRTKPHKSEGCVHVHMGSAYVQQSGHQQSSLEDVPCYHFLRLVCECRSKICILHVENGLPKLHQPTPVRHVPSFSDSGAMLMPSLSCCLNTWPTELS